MLNRILYSLEKFLFNLSLKLGLVSKFDVGVIGLWYGRNYGSMVSYYSLNKQLRSMGLSVLMISNPLERRFAIWWFSNTTPGRLASVHYNVSRNRPLCRMVELNEVCDAFIVGSDQLWNYGLSKRYGQAYFLDFVREGKKKIAYSTSFGKREYTAPEDYKALAKTHLKRFDAISVREKFAVRMCKNHFDIEATQLLDPVFFSKSDDFEELIAKTNLSDRNYVYAYILDPNIQMKLAVNYVAQQLKTNAVVVLDENPARFEDNRKKFGLAATDSALDVRRNVDLNAWLYYFKYSRFVLTDSYHGCCMAIIFRKPFIVVRNVRRGGARFNSLLNPLGLGARLVDKPLDVKGRFDLIRPIEYSEISKLIDKERTRSDNWLRKALS
jgi:hypothetical protein